MELGEALLKCLHKDFSWEVINTALDIQNIPDGYKDLIKQCNR